MLCTTTEQFGDPELSYIEFLGFGVMRGLRRSLVDLRQAWLAKKSGAPPPHRYRPLCIEAFNLWRLMHKHYKPNACRPVVDISMSRLVRWKLSALGPCTYNVGSTHERACQMAWDLREHFQDIVWFDTLYRRLFASSPRSPNPSLNCTGMALLQLRNDLDITLGGRSWMCWSNDTLLLLGGHMTLS